MVVNPLLAIDTQSDRPDEDQFTSWTWIRATARKPGATGWFLEVNGEHHVRAGEDVEGIWEVRAGESGWQGPVGSAHIRVGHLIERWGKLDMLSIADVLNPADLRAGPLSTVEATRLPVPMAHIQVGRGRVRAELALMPFSSADRIDMVGSDWSVIRPGMLDDFLSDAATWEGGSSALLAESVQALQGGLAAASPSTIRGLSSGLSQVGTPEATGLNGEAAVRLELEGRGLDGALMAGALRSHVPATELAPELRQVLKAGAWPEIDELTELTQAISNPLATQWPRTWFAGAEMATTVGQLGLRAEGAWWSDSVLQTPWLGSALSPKLSGGLGLDWMSGTHLLISAEGRYTHHTDAPDDLVLMRASQLDVAGLLRFTTMADRLSLLAAGVLTPKHAEYLARPEARYRITDALEVGVGAVFMGGDKAPPKTLVDAMRYDAGPMANFAQNDCVFAQLQWIQ